MVSFPGLVMVRAVQPQDWAPLIGVVELHVGGLSTYECFLGDVRARHRFVVDQTVVMLRVVREGHIAPFHDLGVYPGLIRHDLPRGLIAVLPDRVLLSDGVVAMQVISRKGCGAFRCSESERDQAREADEGSRDSPHIHSSWTS